jgi:hypothetical protein
VNQPISVTGPQVSSVFRCEPPLVRTGFHPLDRCCAVRSLRQRESPPADWIVKVRRRDDDPWDDAGLRNAGQPRANGLPMEPQVAPRRRSVGCDRAAPWRIMLIWRRLTIAVLAVAVVAIVALWLALPKLTSVGDQEPRPVVVIDA